MKRIDWTFVLQMGIIGAGHAYAAVMIVITLEHWNTIVKIFELCLESIK